MNKEDIKILEEMKYQLIMRNREIENDTDNEVLMSFYEEREEQIQALENLLKRYKELEEENKKLKEYIFVAPNLDEMTAVKYSHIQRDAYIRGRAEEQEKAKQIIYENYVPISVIQNKLEQNKAKTDCRYCNNACDSYAVCTVLKELLKE